MVKMSRFACLLESRFTLHARLSISFSFHPSFPHLSSSSLPTNIQRQCPLACRVLGSMAAPPRPPHTTDLEVSACVRSVFVCSISVLSPHQNVSIRRSANPSRAHPHYFGVFSLSLLVFLVVSQLPSDCRPFFGPCKEPASTEVQLPHRADEHHTCTKPESGWSLRRQRRLYRRRLMITANSQRKLKKKVDYKGKKT